MMGAFFGMRRRRRRQEPLKDWVLRLDGSSSSFFLLVVVVVFLVADFDVFFIVFSHRDDGGTSRRVHLGGVRGHFSVLKKMASFLN